jgi:hypothetical protein
MFHGSLSPIAPQNVRARTSTPNHSVPRRARNGLALLDCEVEGLKTRNRLTEIEVMRIWVGQ